MKAYFKFSLGIAALGFGCAWLWPVETRETRTEESAPFISTTRQPEPRPQPFNPTTVQADIREVPQPTPVIRSAPPKQKIQLAAKNGKKPAPPKADLERYWKQQEQRFNSLLEQLARTTDPKQRARLIEALARHVRVDTLATLDWIATLENAEEQQRALKAVNRYALTGIGARIEMDGSGLPKIRETTILSAADASGMIAAGDYISGMVKEDGTFLNFNGMSLQQIVGNLRGKAGSEIELMIERTGPGGRIHMTVPIQRSMIVMQRFSN